MQNNTTCINCGAQTQGKFCHECGQSLQVKRITLRSMLAELKDKVFGLDSRFVRTLAHGFTKPGVVARCYIEGNRKRYLGPLAYFLLMTTIYLLYINYASIDFEAYAERTAEDLYGYEQNPARLEAQKDLLKKSAKSTRLLYALNALLVALPLWLLFRKKISFLESVMASVYLSAQSIVLAVISLVVFTMGAATASTVISLLPFIFAGWLAATMFTQKASLRNFFIGLLASFLSLVLAVFISMFLAFFAALLLGDAFFELLGIEGVIQDQSD